MNAAALVMSSRDTSLAKAAPASKRLRVSEPGDACEREADKVADLVASGGRVPGWSLSAGGAGAIQRDSNVPGASAPPASPAPDNYGDALVKIGEAFLQTTVGKQLVQAVMERSDVRAIADFAMTPAGIAVGGSAAVGVVSALAVAGKPLPAQLPQIPLSKVLPGLALKITYEGPVNRPTRAMLTLSYAGAPPKKKHGGTDSENYRAQTARMAADQEKFRAGLVSKPSRPPADPSRPSEESLRKAEELHRLGRILQPGAAREPGQFTPLVPGTQPLSLHMRNAGAADPATGTAAAETEKNEEIPIHRKAEGPFEFLPEAANEVQAVVASPGRALEPETRRLMSTRIGFDFSKVRIHTDARAAASAKALGARAYTLGTDVVFGPGRYAPHTTEGRRLLAHELTHVVQQSPDRSIRAPAIRSAPVQVQRDLEEDAKGFSVSDFVSHPRESLKKLARRIPGYELFSVIIGQDPISGEQVVRNGVNLVGGFLKLIGAHETLKNLQESKALEQAFDWLDKETAKLNFSVEYFKGLIQQAIDTVRLRDALDIRGALGRIYEVFKPPLQRAKDFAGAVLEKVAGFVFEGALKLVGGTGVLEILQGAGAAIGAVVKDPIGFLGHLGAALKKGFDNFRDKLGGYLKTGVMDWLFGEIGDVKIPKTITLGSMFNLVLQVLGLTYPNFRKRLVKALGSETAVVYLEGAFEIVKTIATHGIGAAWELILEKAGNLLETVLTAVKDWAITKVVTAAVAQLVLMLNPAGAVIKAIQLIYETLKVFIEKAKKIAELIKAISKSISQIAAGNIDSAAEFIEQAMAKSIPVMISFLAGFLHLGDVGQKVREIIQSLRDRINVGIDKVLDYVVAKGKALLAQGSAAVSKVVDWWQQRKEVTEGAEKHSIYLDGGEDKPMLMIASIPGRTWSEFMADKLKTATPQQQAAIKQLQPDIAKLEQRLPPSKSEDDKAKNVEDKRTLFDRVALQVEALGLHHDAKAPASVIKYEPVRSGDDAGQGVDASVLAPDHPVGSEPADEPRIWKALGTLVQKKNYVQGHLLNHNLGGEGRRFNLTPINKKANSDHLNQVERTVKKAVNVDKKVMSYKVVPLYAPHPAKPQAMRTLEAAAATRKLAPQEESDLKEFQAEQTLCVKFDYEAHELEHDGTAWVAKKNGAKYADEVKHTLAL